MPDLLVRSLTFVAGRQLVSEAVATGTPFTPQFCRARARKEVRVPDGEGDTGWRRVWLCCEVELSDTRYARYIMIEMAR